MVLGSDVFKNPGKLVKSTDFQTHPQRLLLCRYAGCVVLISIPWFCWCVVFGLAFEKYHFKISSRITVHQQKAAYLSRFFSGPSVELSPLSHILCHTFTFHLECPEKMLWRLPAFVKSIIQDIIPSPTLPGHHPCPQVATNHKFLSEFGTKESVASVGKYWHVFFSELYQ